MINLLHILRARPIMHSGQSWAWTWRFNMKVCVSSSSLDWYSCCAHEAALRHTGDVLKHITSYIVAPNGGLMFYEAKRSSEDLENHIPQVVAQCVAM